MNGEALGTVRESVSKQQKVGRSGVAGRSLNPAIRRWRQVGLQSLRPAWPTRQVSGQPGQSWGPVSNITKVEKNRKTPSTSLWLPHAHAHANGHTNIQNTHMHTSKTYENASSSAASRMGFPNEATLLQSRVGEAVADINCPRITWRRWPLLHSSSGFSLKGADSKWSWYDHHNSYVTCKTALETASVL